MKYLYTCLKCNTNMYSESEKAEHICKKEEKKLTLEEIRLKAKELKIPSWWNKKEKTLLKEIADFT